MKNLATWSFFEDGTNIFNLPVNLVLLHKTQKMLKCCPHNYELLSQGMNDGFVRWLLLKQSLLPWEEHGRLKLVQRFRAESLEDEWRSVRRQRFGANTPRSGKSWIVPDSCIDFCWTWSFTFSSNHSIIASGWTLSEQMAINLTGLIPLRYLSCVSVASATLRLTQTGVVAHETQKRAHINTETHTNCTHRLLIQRRNFRYCIWLHCVLSLSTCDYYF